MALSTTAHVERVYSHIAFTLAAKQLNAGQAPEFWTEIDWLADQLLAGQQAPAAVWQDVSAWAVAIETATSPVSESAETPAPSNHVAAPLETPAENLALCRRFLNKAAKFREQWATETERTNLDRRRIALIDIGQEDLRRSKYSIEYNSEGQTPHIQAELELLISLGATARLATPPGTPKASLTSTVAPVEPRARKVNSPPVIALTPPKKKTSKKFRPEPDMEHREEWLRTVSENAGFSAPIPTLEIRNMAGQKLSKEEKRFVEIMRELTRLETRHSNLKRLYAVAPRAKFSELKRSRDLLTRQIRIFWSDHDRLLTSTQRERLMDLRIAVKNLQPPTPKRRSNPWVQFVPGGAPTLGKGHR